MDRFEYFRNYGTNRATYIHSVKMHTTERNITTSFHNENLKSSNKTEVVSYDSAWMLETIENYRGKYKFEYKTLKELYRYKLQYIVRRVQFEIRRCRQWEPYDA